MGVGVQKARNVLLAVLLLVLGTTVFYAKFELKEDTNMLGLLVKSCHVITIPLVLLTIVDIRKLDASCAYASRSFNSPYMLTVGRECIGNKT
jgi:hypothetical protein